jgi:AcrR family transcriptional regulator
MPKNRKPGRRTPKLAYHHGDLRRALLDAALELVAEQGPAGLSLREVARRAGVSHAAPAHHFGDKAGLLTALAVEGFERFLAAQRAAAERGGDDPARRFGWTGWAYVMFAVEQPAYFSLMFRPEHLRMTDPALESAARNAHDFLLATVLAASPDSPDEEEVSMRATFAWSLVHGMATLWLDGGLPQYGQVTDIDALARRLLGLP